MDKLAQELQFLSQKHKFVSSVIDGSLVISNRSKADILNQLKESSYVPVSKKSSLKAKTDDNKNTESLTKFDYLLNMPLSSLSLEKVTQIELEIENLKLEITELSKLTVFVYLIFCYCSV